MSQRLKSASTPTVQPRQLLRSRDLTRPFLGVYSLDSERNTATLTTNSISSPSRTLTAHRNGWTYWTISERLSDGETHKSIVQETPTGSLRCNCHRRNDQWCIHRGVVNDLSQLGLLYHPWNPTHTK